MMTITEKIFALAVLFTKSDAIPLIASYIDTVFIAPQHNCSKKRT